MRRRLSGHPFGWPLRKGCLQEEGGTAGTSGRFLIRWRPQDYCARIKEKLNLRNATELLQAATRWADAQNNF